MRWFITGPLDEDLDRFKFDEPCNIIVLGDACFFNPSKTKLLNLASSSFHNFYCVRGGHENNPEYISGLVTVYDQAVDGLVFCNPEYPNIKYFDDGQVYTIGKRRCLILGGGTALDERELLLKGGEYFDKSILSENEMKDISGFVENEDVDYVFSYTAPISWEKPSNGRYEMELWMNELKDRFSWKVWMFGRYRQDIDLSVNIREIYQDIFRI